MISSASIYGGTFNLFDVSLRKLGIDFTFLHPDVDTETIIAAAGTSCRHQVKDGTGRKALHPIEIMYEAAGLSD